MIRILLLTIPLMLTGCNLIDWGTRVDLEAPGEVIYPMTGQPVPPGSNLGPISITYYTASDKAVALKKSAELFDFVSGSDSEIAGNTKQAEFQMITQMNQAWVGVLGDLLKAVAASQGVPVGPSVAPQSAPPALNPPTPTQGTVTNQDGGEALPDAEGDE